MSHWLLHLPAWLVFPTVFVAFALATCAVGILVSIPEHGLPRVSRPRLVRVARGPRQDPGRYPPGWHPDPVERLLMELHRQLVTFEISVDQFDEIFDRARVTPKWRCALCGRGLHLSVHDLPAGLGGHRPLAGILQTQEEH